MNPLNTNPEEAVALLRQLLDHDLMLRRETAKEFHHKKSDLAMINLLLSVIEKEIEEDTFKPESVKYPRQILLDTLEVLQKISRDIYPKSINFMGLLSSLRQLETDTQSKHGIELQLETNLVDRIKMDDLKETVIYQICSDLVDYFCNIKSSVLRLKLTQVDHQLHIELIAGPIVEIPLPGNQHQINIIKGKIIWLNGALSPDSDWISTVQVSFNLL